MKAQSVLRSTKTRDTRLPAESIFNLDLIDIPAESLEAVVASRKACLAAEVVAAHTAGLLSHMQLITEDAMFITTSRQAFEGVLPHIGTNRLRYLAPTWECRNYSALFCCIVTGVLGCSAVAKTLDFQGHHSYNEVWLYDDDDGTLCTYLVEPQRDQLVQKLDPSRHYTGTGIAICGG